MQDESDGGMTEIRFVPDDKNQLDTMFNVMSDCQVLIYSHFWFVRSQYCLPRSARQKILF